MDYFVVFGASWCGGVVVVGRVLISGRGGDTEGGTGRRGRSVTPGAWELEVRNSRILFFCLFFFFVLSCEIKQASSADKTIENTVGGDAGGARKSILARNTNGRWEQVWTRVAPAPP